MNSPQSTVELLTDYANKGVRFGLSSGIGIGYLTEGEVFCGYSTEMPLPLSTIPFSENTRFDAASLTKNVVNLLALIYIDRGLLSLDTPLYRLVGGLDESWKKITIYHLLTNSFKLDFREELYKKNPAEIEQIITSSRVIGLGDNYYYHNHNSILLGWALENLTRRNLKEIVRSEILIPASMESTHWFNELPKSAMPHVHPSFNKRIDTQPIVGLPHDELARTYAKWHQVVACAGLFTTVPDMMNLSNFIMGNAFRRPENIFPLMLKNYLEPYGKTSGLGFDNPKRDYLCGHFSEKTCVATAYTGGSWWFQPFAQKALVILTNVTYPNTSEERQRNEHGFIIGQSPLFGYRRDLVKQLMSCQLCS